jgi:nitrite reductase (NADH) small subunit
VSALRDVGAVEEFEGDGIHLRRVGHRDLGILLSGGRAVAIRNVCPHAGAPLCRGVLAPLIVGDAREKALSVVHADEERLVLQCPWHGWEFDVDTGRALADERMRVKTYPLLVRDGRVLVDLR